MRCRTRTVRILSNPWIEMRAKRYFEAEEVERNHVGQLLSSNSRLCLGVGLSPFMLPEKLFKL
jgi:hypothetical protein